MTGEGLGWCAARGRMGGRAPTRGGHVGEEECGGRWEWRTVMGWRGVERGATRLFAGPRNGTWGRGGKMGPRMREDKGGVFTPILTFPPQGGREGKEGAHEGRPYGGKSGECVPGNVIIWGVSGRRRSLLGIETSTRWMVSPFRASPRAVVSSSRLWTRVAGAP